MFCSATLKEKSGFNNQELCDVSTSVCSYRKAWSEENALALIKENSGSHFGPDVVEVFLKEIEDSSLDMKR